MLSKRRYYKFRDPGHSDSYVAAEFSGSHLRTWIRSAAWAEYLVYGGCPLRFSRRLKPNEGDLSGEDFSGACTKRISSSAMASTTHLHWSSSPKNLPRQWVRSCPGLRTRSFALHAGISNKTVKRYLDALEDSFLYFRQIEETHLMENVIYNELRMRGYSVDVGAVRVRESRDGKRRDGMQEIDFVVNRGHERFYIQSAWRLEGEEKREQELRPLLKTGDSFRKIVVVGGSQHPWTDDRGITYVGVIPFLLDPPANSASWSISRPIRAVGWPDCAKAACCAARTGNAILG